MVALAITILALLLIAACGVPSLPQPTATAVPQPRATLRPQPTATLRPRPTATTGWFLAPQSPTRTPSSLSGLDPIQQALSSEQAPACFCDTNFYNCLDLETHEKAQACYLYCLSVGAGDVHLIDIDEDGIACEGLLGLTSQPTLASLSPNPTSVPQPTSTPPTTQPTSVPQPTQPPPTNTPVPPAPNCDPSYPDVCLLVGIGDYDCAGGSGNGPNYVEGPIRVLPPDPFGLDRDNDGVGCES